MGIVVLFAAIGLSLIPMFVAREKGRKNLAQWWLFGVVAPVISIVIALIIEPEYSCPNCGRNVRRSAAYCSACGIELPKQSPAVAQEATTPTAPTTTLTPMQREVLRRRQNRS